MTQPYDGPTPEPGQTPAPDATQQIPSEPTQAVPHYSYPTGTPQAPGGEQVPAAAEPAPSPAAPTDPWATPATAAPAMAAPANPYAAGVPLADDPAAGGGPGRGSRKGLLIGGLAAVLVLGAGGVFAAQKLSGGGAQPADVLPGDSYAYFRLDIDPSAGQKIAAVRFLNKIPEVKDTLGSDDMRKKLWEQISKDEKCAAKYDYTKDIEPWLGDRVGVALRPGGTKEEPNAVAALQVKDAAKAKQTIDELAKCSEGSDEVDIVTKNDYLLFTNKGQGDATLAAIDKGNLSANATFSADMAKLGEQGILSAWVNIPPAVKEITNLMGVDAGAVPADATGSGALAVRFDASYIEMAGFTHGTGGKYTFPAGNGTELANLPTDTFAAMHLSGMGEMIEKMWPEMKTAMDKAFTEQGLDDPIAELEDEMDISLPGDLKVLFGKSLTASLPKQDFKKDEPTFGVKLVSEDPTKADELIGKFEDLAGASGVLTRKVDGDKLYVASSSDYVDKLKAGGKLGDDETFKVALGDVSHSTEAIYANLDAIEQSYLDGVPDKYRPAVEALRAVGFNLSVEGDGTNTFSLRIVSN